MTTLTPVAAVAATASSHFGSRVAGNTIDGHGRAGRKPHAIVARLGSERFAEREAATAELLKIGAPAVAALQQALQADDVEVRTRAQKLLNALLPESMPRESVVIEGLNADDGVLLLQGPYAKWTRWENRPRNGARRGPSADYGSPGSTGCSR